MRTPTPPSQKNNSAKEQLGKGKTGMRYLPLGEDDRSVMMAQIGISSVDELFEGVPLSARLAGPLDLPPGSTVDIDADMPPEMQAELRELGLI